MRAHIRDVMSCHDHTFLDWSDIMFSKTLNGSFQAGRLDEAKILSEISSPIAVHCPTHLCCTVLYCIALYCIVLYYAFMAGCGWLAGWLAGSGWPAGWLAGWLAVLGWWAGWLAVGWLADRLAGWLRTCCPNRNLSSNPAACYHRFIC